VLVVLAWALSPACAQGKACYLGSFADPVSAAIQYDRVAAKARGPKAVLNFPPGCKPSPVPVGPHNRSPVLPDIKGGSQAVPTLMPAGSGKGDRVPDAGRKVGLMWGLEWISHRTHTYSHLYRLLNASTLLLSPPTRLVTGFSVPKHRAYCYGEFMTGSANCAAFFFCQ
jgi:hypothetical protein